MSIHKETICVQSGTYHDAATGGVNTPIFTSSSFEYMGREDCLYPRYFNTPNQDTVIRKMWDLEGAEDGVLFSSGMAAISTTVLALAGAGDHIVLLDALSCYLLERSLKTLSLRVERQTENASRIAEFLAGQKAVQKVHYPGLPGFKGHEIARSQMTGFGAMLSFEVDEDQIKIKEFMHRLQIIRPANSLGGVHTTISASAETTHKKFSAEERKRIGITDALLRLSVGIEHVNDLIADLSQALEKE